VFCVQQWKTEAGLKPTEKPAYPLGLKPRGLRWAVFCHSFVEPGAAPNTQPAIKSGSAVHLKETRQFMVAILSATVEVISDDPVAAKDVHKLILTNAGDEDQGWQTSVCILKEKWEQSSQKISGLPDQARVVARTTLGFWRILNRDVERHVAAGHRPRPAAGQV
jgi:hypothetical protein